MLWQLLNVRVWGLGGSGQIKANEGEPCACSTVVEPMIVRPQLGALIEGSCDVETTCIWAHTSTSNPLGLCGLPQNMSSFTSPGIRIHYIPWTAQ